MVLGWLFVPWYLSWWAAGQILPIVRGRRNEWQRWNDDPWRTATGIAGTTGVAGTTSSGGVTSIGAATGIAGTISIGDTTSIAGTASIGGTTCIAGTINIAGTASIAGVSIVGGTTVSVACRATVVVLLLTAVRGICNGWCDDWWVRQYWRHSRYRWDGRRRRCGNQRHARTVQRL